MSAAYLDKLNPEQRSAVEHGPLRDGAHIGPPLLVIAGAGSGKTSTLAHRVAHLIMSGVDPGRILLLTFSRRAAAEMRRRAELILGEAMRRSAGARSRRSVGRAPSTASALASCATMPPISVSTRLSPSMTARTAPI